MNQSISKSPPSIEHDDDDALDLVAYLDFIIDSRWLIGSIAFALMLLGIAYAWTVIPIYKANILIQVEDSVSSSKNILGDLSAMFDTKTASSAEMEVLHSRFVVTQAVESAHLDINVQPKYFPLIGAAISRYNKQLSVPGLFGVGGYVWGTERLNVPVFNVPRNLQNQRFILTANSNSSFHLMQDEATIDVIGQVGVALRIKTASGVIELLVDHLEAKPGAQFFLYRALTLATVEKLQNSLMIAERGKQSGIIGVELEGADPQRVALILNELGGEYIRQNVERKSEEAEKSLIFLDKQLPDLKLQLERSEDKYTTLRNDRGTVDLQEEAKSVLQQSILAQTKVIELKQKRDELLVRFQSANPIVQAVNQQIASLNGELESIEARIKKMPQTEQELFRLTRDVKVNTDLYISLLNSAQQLRLVKASKVGNARLLDLAVVPLLPVSPNRLLIIIVALIGGLLIGVAVALVRKVLFGGVEDPHEIEQKLGVTVSSLIPHSLIQESLYSKIAARVKQVSVLVHDTPSDPVIESLRSLRTSLQFSMLEAKNNIVMITGPTPGVGKSFVSVNFAAVLALTGKKILLIDGDLRKGYLHRYLGLERKNGLSEVILNQISLSQAIQKNLVENVDFIATGTLPSRSAELLGHSNFLKIIETVKADYDIVLIDTAPVLAATDALVIATCAGTIFSVVRGGVSTMGEIEETVKRVKQAGSNITGIVLNDLKVRSRQYGYGSKHGKYRYTQYKY